MPPAPTAFYSRGIYRALVGDDGGNYYVRHTDDGVIWWFGVALDSPPRFSNVAKGTIVGDSIQLEWVDVPWGRARSGGVLTLSIAPNGRALTRVTRTGGLVGRTGSEVRASPGARLAVCNHKTIAMGAPPCVGLLGLLRQRMGAGGRTRDGRKSAWQRGRADGVAVGRR